MNRKIHLIGLTAALLTSQNSAAWFDEQSFQSKGFVRGELPEKVSSSDHEQQDESAGFNTDARLESQWATNAVTLDAVLYGKYRSQYQDDDQAVKDDMLSDGEVRELFSTWESDNWLFKVGRQQVAWGKGDFFRIVDVINPLDLREGLLPYLDDYSLGRKTRDMVIVEHYRGDVEYQLVLASGRNHTEYAPTGSEFAVMGLPDGTPEEETSPDVGVRTRLFSELGDFDLYAFRGKSPDAQFQLTGTQIDASLQDRALVATSFATPNSVGVLRSDLAYYSKEPLQVGFDTVTIQKFDALIGLDIQQGEWTWNLQASSSQLLDVPDSYTDETEIYSGSLAVDKEWPQQRLVSSLIWLVNYEEHISHLAKFNVTYDWFSETELEWGVVSFSGSEESLHGQYDDLDRVYLNIKQQFDF